MRCKSQVLGRVVIGAAAIAALDRFAQVAFVPAGVALEHAGRPAADHHSVGSSLVEHSQLRRVGLRGNGRPRSGVIEMRQSIEDAETRKLEPYTTIDLEKIMEEATQEPKAQEPEAVVPPAGPKYVSTLQTPKDAYFEMVEKGVTNANLPAMKTLHAAIMGGAYVGIAGILSLSIAGNIPGIAAQNPGFQRMVFAALFPMNLLLILNSGAQLFTGNSMVLPAAVFEGRATLGQVLRSWTLSTIGNLIGCVGVAMLLEMSGLLVDGTRAMAISTVIKKTSIGGWGKAFVRAVCCNWLVCMGVMMGTSAKDLAGRMVGIWFPISTFVAIGFEHSVANMFLLPLGLFAGAAVSWKTAFLSNLLPVYIGNALAGALIVALGFSFQFGRAGRRVEQ
eukprot:CAMPEP_0178430606 /NCGR_PEP_ID=MMETSP0689_2-20121128/31410_1 /TAXON_ID=160604 /ORGANISM="Amphidinium massartii, Strain CS-259" /LENGTH=390 /DNA_ID=CAMNT_0020052475 /DNA_START=55 /DNA_END=1227 /DNA_ORIENTATION=-